MIIFLCHDDIFGKGRAVYRFKNLEIDDMRALAEEERARADKAEARADEAEARADKYEKMLRELGKL